MKYYIERKSADGVRWIIALRGYDSATEATLAALVYLPPGSEWRMIID